MKYSWKVIIQFACIIIGIFGIIASFVTMFGYWSSTVTFFRGAYAIIFCSILILCEVYIFAFFKYFGFLLKPWGKALMYLFVGALLFQKNGFELFCGIIYWALAVVFCVMGFLIKQMPPPLMQGGLKGGSPPDITIDANAIYEGGEKGSGGGNKSTLYQGINDDV